MANWTRTFSPRLVNDARIAFSRIVIDDSVSDWSGLLGPDGNQKFGISGGQPIPGLSSIRVRWRSRWTSHQYRRHRHLSNYSDNKYQAQTNLTYQAGSHLLKFGGQLIRFQQNRFYAGNNGVLGVFRY